LNILKKCLGEQIGFPLIAKTTDPHLTFDAKRLDLDTSEKQCNHWLGRATDPLHRLQIVWKH
jgi:hypothetical protein